MTQTDQFDDASIVQQSKVNC